MGTSSTTLMLIIVLLIAYPPSTSLAIGERNDSSVNSIDTQSFSKSTCQENIQSTFIRISGPTISSTIWEHIVTSTHFSVYYNTTGSHATTHGYAHNVSNSFEYSWTREVTDFGFNAPPDSHITVYLEDLPHGTFGVTFFYYNPITGWHVENITIDVGMGSGLASATCAHEFFHTIQLSYDPTELYWIAEGTAVWMESKVYPDYTGYGSYVDYVNFYMSFPDETITQLDYDACLFWIFLDEHYGGISTIENIMQQTISTDGIFAVNATLNNQGTSFTNAFREWTIANYLKDSYYSNGELFDSVDSIQYNYNGETIDYNGDVIDWGVDYFEISSSVIYMPILFDGEESHNVTKILIEHNLPSITDFPLNSTYVAFFPLMQASNLDKIVIIVRSFGNETSNNRVWYTLTLLASSYTLEGPYYLNSSTTTMTIIETTGIHLSSALTLAVANKLDSQSTSTFILAVANRSSSQSSPISTIATINGSSVQTCSPRTTTVANRSSSQTSSETAPINVRMEGDVNGDGTVDILDLEALSDAYGSQLGDPNWNPDCDFNRDGIIDMYDLAICGKNYGKTV